MRRLHADALLTLCALIWGTAFVAQKIPYASAWPLRFVAARFAISALLLVPLTLLEARRARTPAAAASQLRMLPRDWLLGVGVGLCLCAAASLQQLALTSTTATHGGFLTAIYVVCVPFTTWLIARRPPRRAVLIACGLSLAGAWLLSSSDTGSGGASASRSGDLLLLASDLFWALQITLINRFLSRRDRPFLLCLLQYALTAAVAGALACSVAAGASAIAPAAGARLRDALPALLYAGGASGGIAFTLQIVAQRHTPPAEAALIMSLESVFAALAGAWLLHERLTPTAVLGCALILLGSIVVELAPALRIWLRSVWHG